ncbi:hypothetical protein [Arthrobacter sp. H35-D1]|uniref:hypothetical protein n=1 Tax=Arthrobacter sp. H35-D1 TaxID=3046202 RepID=UPI0024BB76C1|nr:hypothetical protein [Arthrobacter sp. H35-D1]MDJ0315063.1 hypothetical protein [Arthrobacter sp. H35-D1]
MTEKWVPPAISNEEYERLTAIEVGFPDYVRNQVESWVVDSASSRGQFAHALPRFLSRHMKRVFSLDYSGFLLQVHQLEDDELANVIDCMLFHGLKTASVYDLGKVLAESRAGWVLTSDGRGRTRVTAAQPSGVIQALEGVMNKTAKAGALLGEAFEAAYGTSTNPNHAYDLSVKAVETLACPAFIPNNTTRATLGTVIKHLEQKNVSLPLVEKNADHRETLTKMMRLLWEGGQRHGEETYEHVSLGGARTAHALATCLVSMIHEDVITVV